MTKLFYRSTAALAAFASLATALPVHAFELHTTLRRTIANTYQFQYDQATQTAPLTDAASNGAFSLTTSAEYGHIAFSATAKLATGIRHEQEEAIAGSSDRIFIAPEAAAASGWLRFTLASRIGASQTLAIGPDLYSRARGQTFLEINYLPDHTGFPGDFAYATVIDNQNSAGAVTGQPQRIVNGSSEPFAYYAGGGDTDTSTFEIPFLTATPLSLTFGGYCEALAYAPAPGGTSRAECSLDLRWLGVAAVLGADHQPLGGLTRLISDSGFDYGSFQGPTLPPVGGVPEPASWAMLIAGFGLAGAALRRRRQLCTASSFQPSGSVAKAA